MAKVVPFRGVRYNPAIFTNLNDVTAPPHDKNSESDFFSLSDVNEYNIARVTCDPKADIDKLLSDMLDNKILIRDETPALYIYEQIFSLNDGKPAHSLKGIICLTELCDYSENTVLPFEDVVHDTSGRASDIIASSKSDTEPIFSLYSDDNETIARLMEKNIERAPDITFNTSDNIHQNVWIVTDCDVLSKVTEFFKNRQIFIASGHDNYEAALRYRDERHKKDGTPVGSADYDYVMTMLVSMSSSGLFSFPTHRLIRNLDRFDETMTVGFLTEQFAASKIHFTEGDYASIITDRLAQTVDEKLIALYTGADHYYLLKLKNFDASDMAFPDKSPAYRHLDVTVLHKLILENNFGIASDTSDAEKFISYTKDASYAIDSVRSGKSQCAFLINPTKISEIRSIATANERMPLCSTYFKPGFVSGIVINKFD